MDQPHTYVRHDVTFMSEGTPARRGCTAPTASRIRRSWCWRTGSPRSGNCAWTPTPHGSPRPATPRWCSTTGTGVPAADDPAGSSTSGPACRLARRHRLRPQPRRRRHHPGGGLGFLLRRRTRSGLAAHDHDLAAAIVQVPHVTGPASAFAQSPKLVARLVVAALRDQVGAWLGRQPYRVTVHRTTRARLP